MAESAVRRKTEYTMLVATELTVEDMLEIFTVLASKLTHERDNALAKASTWKREFEMYRSAWLREMGGKLCHKTHDIDAFVKTMKYHYERSQKWDAYENRLLNRDPFWMVPAPPESEAERMPE